MQVEEELAGLSPQKDTLLTIGVFDGVHLGHKYLLSQLKEHAEKRNMLSGVVTFRRHPQEMLSPRTKLPSLTGLAQRISLLKNEGVNIIVTLSFTTELAQLTARQFVSLLMKHLRMRGLVVGPDFALGQNREGTIDTLRTMGQDMNFSITVIPPILINGEVISSTAIRKALAIGDMKKVHSLVGRFFNLEGRVTAGAGRGTGLGYPTANIAITPEQALPPDGIYATLAHIDDHVYPSMTYVGKQPTFKGSKRTVEVYIIDYHSDLYENELSIDIIERLRGDRQFATVDELKKQIAKDVERGKAILNSRGNE